MSIGGIDTPTEIDGVPVVEQGANSELDRDAFLQLLVAQLANQDPLDPISNEDFVAQQATFSQLEQQLALNEKFDEFLEDQREVFTGITGIFGSLQSTSFLGQEVEFNSDSMAIQDGLVSQLYFDTNESLNVGYTILNQSGNVVAVGEQKVVPSGDGHSTAFNGLGLDGNPLPDGNYRVVFNVTNSAGDVFEGSGYARRTVSSVDFRAGIPVLKFSNGESVPLDQVLSLNQGGDLING